MIIVIFYKIISSFNVSWTLSKSMGLHEVCETWHEWRTKGKQMCFIAREYGVKFSFPWVTYIVYFAIWVLFQGHKAEIFCFKIHIKCRKFWIFWKKINNYKTQYIIICKKLSKSLCSSLHRKRNFVSVLLHCECQPDIPPLQY